MLAEFELQLQATLRSKLPAEIRDRVQLASGASDQTGILVGIRSAQPQSAEFGSVRSEIAPGVTIPRRVVRLRCALDCTFVPVDGLQARSELMTWLGQVVYALDDADVRSGAAFTGVAADPGFVIHSVSVDNLDSPFDIHAAGAQRLQLSLLADGWFWPVGEPGQAGVEIGEIRIRGALLPLLLTPASPIFVANGPALNLRIDFGPSGVSRVTAGALNSDTFGNLKARLEKDDGTVGAGALTGGSAGPDGSRLLPVTDDHIEFSYTPPAVPGTDLLLLSMDDDESGNSIQIGRFTLVTGAA